MTSHRNELKAGLFILVTIILAVSVIVAIKGTNVGTAQVRTIVFKVGDDLGGLQIGDDVRLGGYKVGIIREIHPEDLDGPNPRIVVSVNLPSHYILRRDTVIAIQSGLTGTSNLNIESVGVGEPLPDHVPLPGFPDPKNALLASLGRAGPHLENAITQVETHTVPNLNQLLTHVDGQVDPVVQKYNRLADSATGAMTDVSSLLGDTKPDIRGTLKNLNAVSGTLKEKLPGTLDQINGAIVKVDGALNTAHAALLDVQKAASDAKDTMATLRAVIVENQGKLDGIITGVKTTSDNLKEASIELRHSPWRLLYKPTPDEAGNMNLYDSAREFAVGAGSLSDAATALRDAMRDPKADPAKIQKLVKDLDSTFSKFRDVETKLWNTAKP